MRITYMAGELVTGRRLTQLPVTAGPWSTVLNDAGEIGVTIPLADPKIGNRSEIMAQLEPWRCFLAVVANGAVLEAGPIVAHDSFNDTTGELSVKALGLGAIFDRRTLVPPNGDPIEGELSWSGLSLRTIAKRIVQNALAQPGGDLPVNLEADFSGDHERTYPGYELAASGERLNELIGVEGGPDIAYRPHLTEDRLAIEWDMLTGDPLLRQTGQDHVWDTSVPRGPVSGVSVKTDAGSRANRVFASGDGMETTLLLGTAQDSSQWDRGYPLLDMVTSHSSVKRVRTLEGHARSAMQVGRKPWTTWQITVKADMVPALGTYWPGDWCRVVVPRDHVYLTGGEYRARIGKIAGDASGQNVQIDLLPTLEAR